MYGTKTEPMSFADFAERILRMNQGRPQPEQLNSGGTWGPVQPPLGDVQQFRMFEDSQADPAFPVVQRNFAADPTQPTLVFDDSMLPPPPATQPPQRSFLDFNSPQAQPYSLPAEQGFRAMQPLTETEKIAATGGDINTRRGGPPDVAGAALDTRLSPGGKVQHNAQGQILEAIVDEKMQNAQSLDEFVAALDMMFDPQKIANMRPDRVKQLMEGPYYELWLRAKLMQIEQAAQGGMGNGPIDQLQKAYKQFPNAAHIGLDPKNPVLSIQSTTSVEAAKERNRGAKDRQTTDLEFKREQNAAKHGHEIKMRKMDNAVKWLEMQMESGDQDAKRQYAMMKAKTEPLYMQIDALYDEFSNTRDPDRKAEIQNQISAYHTRIATILRNFELSLEKTNKGLFDDYTEFAKFGESAE